MPNQSSSNIIGRKGERWFQSQIPADWIFQIPSEDIGVDGTVVICDNSPMKGTEFRVQIKSSTKFKNSKQLTISKVKRSTFIYWLTGFTPTLLVIYDTNKNEGYYFWANKLINYNKNLLETTDTEINLSIPKSQKIDVKCWDNIKNDLKELRISISNIIHDQSVLLPYLHDLMEIIQRLNYSETVKKIDGSEPSKDDLLFLWEVEMNCHKQFILLVEEMLTLIKEETSTCLYIKNIIIGYKEICKTFCINFNEAVYHWKPGFEIGVIPKVMAKERHRLMGIIINLVKSFLLPYKKADRPKTAANKSIAASGAGQ